MSPAVVTEFERELLGERVKDGVADASKAPRAPDTALFELMLSGATETAPHVGNLAPLSAALRSDVPHAPVRIRGPGVEPQNGSHEGHELACQ